MKFNEVIDSNIIVYYFILLFILNINFVFYFYNNMFMLWLFIGIVLKNMNIFKIK